MPVKPATRSVLRVIRGLLSYQFTPRVAEALTTPEEEVSVEYSSTGRVRFVRLQGERILTRRAGDGLFSLSLKAASVVLGVEPPPRFRVAVREPEYVSGGVLAVNVDWIDGFLRPGDEVIIVDSEDRLLGVGRLRVPPSMLAGLERGEVVRVRRVVGRGGVEP
ncbi:PUA domain-containing protein [Stetteria hydrogenophila]